MNTSRRSFLAGSVGGLSVLGTSAADLQAAVSKPRFFSQYDPQIRKLLSQMTLDEKIGQMTQPDQMYLKTLDDIDNYHLGSLLSGGDSDPKTGNDLTSWTDMYDHYQERALKTRLRIPLLYGVDAVHGHNNVIGAVVFPHNVGLGCTRDSKLVEAAARVTSEEVKATGINWAFAPCVTVPQDIRWGRTYEGFSENTDVVKMLGAAANRGLQRARLDDPLAVLACAKHFIGDGGTSFGTGQPKGNSGQRYPLDQGDTRVDEATLRKIHLPGYITTIAGGVGSMMPSYSSWNGVKCSASKRLMTEILKDELGFEGFLISDYAALNQLPGSYKEQIETSINAGMDMVMVPEKYVDFFNNLKASVTEGRVPMTRIDDAVTRILRTKFAMGMMNAKNPQLADRKLHKTFGSADHRAVARDAVRKSLVVLKNDNHVLPLSKDAHVHVAGKGHDDIGIQCGGWTITWQGKAGATTKGTTILEGIHKAVAHSTVVSHSADGSHTEGAKVGIAVIGETPYAEMMGDRTDLHIDAEDIAVIEKMKSAGLPVVVVLLSGRPMLIDKILGSADAIVAAWLPGSEGDGVADVLFGDYKPTGKLSFTWPKDTATSLSRGDPGYQTLFPFGHGLSF
jgi:beta-glucosidase